MLDLTTHEPLSQTELAPPEDRRSPVIALLLSLLFPGFGHFYVGLPTHARWLILTQAIALAVMIYGSGNLHGQAILVVLALYCFAMADAYFSAREWNAGATSLLTGANPRIAAVLNLLTKGFGYFYLGDRIKGVVCFIAIGAIQVAVLTKLNVWTSILAVTFQIAIAADAYRVARQSLLANHPDLSHSEDGGPGVIERANPTGLNPVAASAFFVILGTTAVIGYSALRALSGNPVDAQGTLEQGPSGLLYRNASEHIEVTAPTSWEYSRPKNTLAQLTGDDGSSVIVMEEFAIYAVGSTIEANRAALLKNHPDAAITTSDTTLAGRSVESIEASFKNPASLLIHQRFIVRRRGLKMFFMVETWTDAEQRSVLDAIEKTVQI